MEELAGGSRDSREINENCQFLKCTPKDKRRKIPDECGSSEKVNADNNSDVDDEETGSSLGNYDEQLDVLSDSDVCGGVGVETKNEISAVRNGEGWCVRWSVCDQRENDFIGLCGLGELAEIRAQPRLLLRGNMGKSHMQILPYAVIDKSLIELFPETK